MKNCDETDFVQCFGRSNIFSGNLITNLYVSGYHPNHTDFFQTFGITYGSSGHIIEIAGSQ